MSGVTVNRTEFLNDRQGRTFADVFDFDLPFREVLEFFSDSSRQRRMEESEIHHDRAPLAGVVREFEAEPSVDRFFKAQDSPASKRLRQAVGVLVRIIMERRGWRKTGRKGSLGIRSSTDRRSSANGTPHNTGGLSLWFLRAERYEMFDGVQFETVRARCAEVNPDKWDVPEQVKTSRRTPTGRTSPSKVPAQAGMRKRPQ